MKNKKGFTVVEILITFSFVMLISIGMLNIVSNYREKEQNEEVAKTMETYKNEILKAVQDDIVLYGVEEIENITNESELESYDRGVKITFKNLPSSTKNILVKQKTSEAKAEIKYGDIIYKAPDMYVNMVSDIMLYESNEFDSYPWIKKIYNGYDWGLETKIFKINIKMLHEESNKNYNINIVAVKENMYKTDNGIVECYKWVYGNLVFDPTLDTSCELASEGSTLVIPDVIDDKKVTTINYNTFEVFRSGRPYSDHKFNVDFNSASYLETIGFSTFSSTKLFGDITIPDTVITIGDDAFGNLSLQKVTIGKKVETIGRRAFIGNSSRGGINELVFSGDKLKTIMLSAFRFNNLTSVKLPNNLKEIGNYAFSDGKINNLTLSNNLEKIGEYAFYNQDNSEVGLNLFIPNSVTTIGKNAFDNSGLISLNANSNMNYTPKGIENIEANTFSNNKIDHINISNNIKSIGDSAFNKNILDSITIGTGVTTIGNSAFADNELSFVNIPNTVSSIGIDAFSQNEFTSLDFSTITNKITSIPEGCFKNNELESLIITNNIKTIGNYAFSGNKLKKIMIPNSVEYINTGAFKNAGLRETIEIPNSVTSIGNEAFATTDDVEDDYKNEFSNVIINGTQTIGEKAFLNSFDSNSTLTINEGVITIKKGAFSNTSLKSRLTNTVAIPESVTTVGENIFLNQSSISKIVINGWTDSDTFDPFWNCKEIVPGFIWLYGGCFPEPEDDYYVSRGYCHAIKYQ